MHQTLGHFIRQRRQDLGLTQEQLAERAGEGMRQAEISRLEHDYITLPRRNRLEQLATALDVSLGDLLIRTGWMGEENRSAFLADSSPGDSPSPDDLDAITLESLAMAVETLSTVQEMVAKTAMMLDDAERTMTTVMRALNIAYSPQSIIRPKLGVIDDWESAAILYI